MKFKQFINEAAVSEPLSYESHEIDKAADLFLTHCKDAMWMIENNTPLYRGDKSIDFSNEVQIIDPSQTERKSENNPNHYTVLMDNLPSWKEYPKRSRSLICTTSKAKASIFASYKNRNTAIVIPFDNVKIGVCPVGDIWDVRFFNSLYFSGIPDTFEDLGISSKTGNLWNKFIKFSKDVKNEDFINDLKTKGLPLSTSLILDLILESKSDFMSWLDDMMNPDKLKFDNTTTKNLSSCITDKSECWIGGKVLTTSIDNWNDFRNAVLERAK